MSVHTELSSISLLTPQSRPLNPGILTFRLDDSLSRDLYLVGCLRHLWSLYIRLGPCVFMHCLITPGVISQSI